MSDTLEQSPLNIEWTGQSLRDLRLKLKLRQKDVSEFVGCSGVTISHIENDISVNPLLKLGYATILEKEYALKQGYMPSYRKIGTSEFTDKL